MSETYRNITSRPLTAIATIVVSVVAASAVSFITLGSMSFFSDTLGAQIARGSHVFAVTTSVPNSIDAARCDQLLSVEGVRSAGAVMGTRTVAFDRAPDQRVTVMTVTPGFPRVAFPSQELDETGGVAAGFAIATELGVTRGTRLNTGDHINQVATVSFVQPDVAERLFGTSRALLEPAAPRGMVSECYVETERAERGAVESLLASWFDPDLSWNVVPLVTPAQLEMDVDSSVRQIPVGLIGALSAGIAVAFNVLLWWSRRQEFALYSIFGFRLTQFLSMLVLEYSALVIAPAGVAMCVAAACIQVENILPEFLPFIFGGVASFWLILSIGPPVAIVLIRSRGVSIAIKGG